MNAPAASILVVDDEPDLRTLYELTLLREGYRVETAATLLEARQQLQAKRFDVVISDMRLPDGFGMELLHDLRFMRGATSIHYLEQKLAEETKKKT